MPESPDELAEMPRNRGPIVTDCVGWLWPGRSWGVVVVFLAGFLVVIGNVLVCAHGLSSNSFEPQLELCFCGWSARRES